MAELEEDARNRRALEEGEAVTDLRESLGDAVVDDLLVRVYTKEQVLWELVRLGRGAYNQETRHVIADLLLVRYINDPDITKAFLAIDKWYS